MDHLTPFFAHFARVAPLLKIVVIDTVSYLWLDKGLTKCSIIVAIKNRLSWKTPLTEHRHTQKLAN